MTTHTSLSTPDRIRSSAATARAIAGSILGSVAILAIVGLAALVVPAAAAIVFGPVLLDLV